MKDQLEGSAFVTSDKLSTVYKHSTFCHRSTSVNIGARIEVELHGWIAQWKVLELRVRSSEVDSRLTFF